MAFEQFKLETATFQARGIFNNYVYSTPDSMADVQATGYFIHSRFSENVDWFVSYIECKCGDGTFTGVMDATGTLTGNVVPASSTPVSSHVLGYTAKASDSTITMNATALALTVALPTAVGISGKKYTIKKTDASVNAVTVDADGSETIDGATTKDLAAQWDYVTIQSNGTNWLIVG